MKISYYYKKKRQRILLYILFEIFRYLNFKHNDNKNASAK